MLNLIGLILTNSQKQKSKVISAVGLEHNALFGGHVGLEGWQVFVNSPATWTNFIGRFGMLGQDVPFEVTALVGYLSTWPAPVAPFLIIPNTLGHLFHMFQGQAVCARANSTSNSF